MRRNSVMKMYGPGEVLWEPSEEGPSSPSGGTAAPHGGAMPGMFVVISGVVRLDLEVEGRVVPMFLGSGERALPYIRRDTDPPLICPRQI